MALKRMDNIGIVVEDLDSTIAFFKALGLELEGRVMVEGEWAGRVTGLGDQEVEIAMMRTPDGHSRLELSRFLRPAVVADNRWAPVNALGYLRAMFAVTDLDETLQTLSKHGAACGRGRAISAELPALLRSRARRIADRARAGAWLSTGPAQAPGVPDVVLLCSGAPCSNWVVVDWVR